MSDYTVEWDQDYSEESFEKSMRFLDHLCSYTAETEIQFLRYDTLWRPEPSADSCYIDLVVVNRLLPQITDLVLFL